MVLGTIGQYDSITTTEEEEEGIRKKRNSTSINRVIEAIETDEEGSMSVKSFVNHRILLAK